MTLTQRDRDILIRTIIGEAANEGPEGWAGVAHTIRNRSLDPRWPSGVADVSLQPKQFSAWNKGAGGNHLVHKYGPGSGIYQNVGQIADQVFAGDYADPTGGATHYYSPAGMRALVNSGSQSNVLPRWLQKETDRRGGNTVTIGGHVFTGRANSAAPATDRAGMLSDEAVGASFRSPTPPIGNKPAQPPETMMAFAPQGRANRAAFEALGVGSNAPQPAALPMASTTPAPVQGQTATLAPTVAEGNGMAKTVSTTLAPTPQQIAQRQAMAKALAREADNVQVIRHPLQGVDKMAKSALAGYQQMKARQGETQRAGAMANLIGGMSGNAGGYSQQQISQAAALDPQMGMGMIQHNQRLAAAEAERARNTPMLELEMERARLANEQARVDLDNSRNPALKAPTTKEITTSDGAEVVVQWDPSKIDPQTNKPGVWVPMNAPEGGRAVSDRVKLTENQSKLTLFQSLQTETAPALDDLETLFNPANLPDYFAGNVLGGNFYRSREGQIYDAASTAWAEGALRIATGAAATPEEMDRTKRAYFAQPGDSPETIKWKSHMRAMYARSIQRGLGQTNVPERLPMPSEFLEDFQGGGVNDPSENADYSTMTDEQLEAIVNGR